MSARVVDFVSEVTVKQEYFNRESNPIEAVYNFPVEEESAVTDFEAHVDGRTVSCSTIRHFCNKYLLKIVGRSLLYSFYR